MTTIYCQRNLHRIPFPDLHRMLMSSRFSYLLEAFAVERGCAVSVQGVISIHADLWVMMCSCSIAIAGERKEETVPL